MHDTHQLLEARARRVLTERIRPVEFQPVAQLQVQAWQVTDNADNAIQDPLSQAAHPLRPEVSGQGEPVSFAYASQQEFTDFTIGRSWGPAWGTTWFKMTIPAGAIADEDITKLEIQVDLGWEDHSPGFQAEGIIYTNTGKIVKAINPRNNWIPLAQLDSEQALKQEMALSFYVEAAANPLLLGVPPFQKTFDGDKTTANPNHLYQLRSAQVVRVHHEVRALAFDVEILAGLALTLPEGSQERARLTLELNDALDNLDLNDVVNSAPLVRSKLKPILENQAWPNAHEITAVGHAHIDSAWLWPIRETRRKVVRTIANVIRLLEDGSPMVFALPAAQHVAWLETDCPNLFSRLKYWVKTGHITPVGGMWVEPDAMLPSGEAMCRQLLYGQRYFIEKLGVTCQGIWLPDSFGYSAALPQIGLLGGAKWFLTQKISWNQTDVFPHHTLWWEGIDGSRIFTHFPPVDTYGAEITPHQVHHAANNFKDKARANLSLLPYGYGDGGGGPTRDMLERAQRMSNLAGAAKIKHDTPNNFFTRALQDYPQAPVWVGEIYLELHRGTSTTQANTKLGNRNSEGLLRQAELWLATAAVAGLLDYPYAQLQALWQKVLLAQFHDILPGTSIKWVYKEIEAQYQQISEDIQIIITQAQQAISTAIGQSLCFNAASHTRAGVPGLGWITHNDHSQIEPPVTAKQNKIIPDKTGWTWENQYLHVHINTAGLVDELWQLTSSPSQDTNNSSSNNTISRNVALAHQPLGQLWLYQDFPNMWDAWDIDEFYRTTGKQLIAKEVSVESDGIVAKYEFGNSKVTVLFRLPDNAARLDVQVNADWHECEKILKLHFPLDIHTDHATYETQMGHLVRPIHDNTTWESNKFEVASHRWVHVGETNFGVGITNSCTYGWSHHRSAHPAGGTYVTLAASILRAPVFPDPQTDLGYHERSFSILPGADRQTTWQDAYRLQLPLQSVIIDNPSTLPEKTVHPLVSQVSGAVIEAVKIAEDQSGALIIRAYEPSGTRSHVEIKLGVKAQSCMPVGILEDPQQLPTETQIPQVYFDPDTSTISTTLRPFQIVTLRIEGVTCE